MNEKNHIIYLHVNANTNKIFYVGQTTNTERPYTVHGRSKKWMEIVQTDGFYTVILYEGLSVDEANETETALIKNHGIIKNGGTLTNRVEKAIVRKKECPHCKKVGQSGPMGRWHFKNCPDNPENQTQEKQQEIAKKRLANAAALQKTSPLWKEARSKK